MTTCPYCADPIEETHTFCPHCGEGLETESPSDAGNPFASKAVVDDAPAKAVDDPPAKAAADPPAKAVDEPSVAPLRARKPSAYVADRSDDDDRFDREYSDGAVERPGGVTFYAWADCIFGGLGVGAALLMFIGAIALFASSDRYASLFGVIILVVAAITIVTSAPLLTMGIGLFRMRGWARMMALIVSWLFGAISVLQILFMLIVIIERAASGRRFHGEWFASAFGMFLTLAFYGGQIYILMKSETKDAFDAAAS